MKTALRKKLPLGLGILYAAAFGLYGCSNAKTVDFKEHFDYRIHGFSGDGVLLSDVMPRALKDDFAELVDNNDENNIEFLNNIFYDASQKENLKNGDEITVTVNCNEDLAKKAGLKPENTTFTLKVEGLTELADDSSKLEDQFDSLQSENEKALRESLTENNKFAASKTDQFTTPCYVDASTLEHQGSALVYLTDSSDGISRWNSNYLSLYTAKYSSDSERLDDQYCYVLGWMPQTLEDGSFGAEDLSAGQTIEIERASNLDKELFGLSTEDLNTSSAQSAKEKEMKLDQDLTRAIIDHLYPQKKSGISMFSSDNGQRISEKDLKDAFDEAQKEQTAIADDIHFETGMNLVTLSDLQLQNKSSLGAVTYGERLPAGSSVTLYEVCAKPADSLYYGEVYGRINENQWIRLEDKKYFYAIPEDDYSRLIQNGSCLLKNNEGVSPFTYPSSAENGASDADPAVKAQDSDSENKITGSSPGSSAGSGVFAGSGNSSADSGSSGSSSSSASSSAGEELSGPSETYVLTATNQYVYSYSEPNMYGMSVHVNKYPKGSEVQIYATKEVDFQGTYGQIGKNEWVLLNSVNDGPLWTKQ